MFEIQRLLVMLQTADVRAWSTEDLTKSFGWKQNEGQQQQDIHELNRILFEAIEKALSKTPYDSLVQELYFGHTNRVITCTLCNESRKRPETFLDLMLTVKGMKGVKESLENLFTFEELDGVECETCQSKTT